MVAVSQFDLLAEAWDPATATARTLDVKSMTIALDIDRVPYLNIELVISPVDDTTYAWLDPRGVRRLRWRATHNWIGYTSETGATSALLPLTGYGMCCIRNRKRRILTGEITLHVTSFELLLDDKRRISSTTVNTGATTLKGLVDYAVTNLADSYTDINTTVLDPFGASVVSIPSGDRRLWMQGESLTDLFEGELTALSGRLITTTNGNQFVIDSNSRSVGAGLLLLLYTADYTGPLDGSSNARILGEPEEITDREAWADGALVKYSYVNGSGVTVTSYQASGSGVNKRGIVTTRERPAPAGNAANGVADRMKTRGKTYYIDAEADMKVFPLMTCAIRIGNAAAVIGKVTAVEWALPAGTMTVKVNVE